MDQPAEKWKAVRAGREWGWQQKGNWGRRARVGKGRGKSER